MCGRIAQSEPSRYAQRLGAVLEAAGAWRPSWNLAPTALLLGVRDDAGKRVLSPYRWGLLPAWAEDPGLAARTFNARAETVSQKPVFRHAFRRRRLLVPVDGFYEWAAVPGEARKQPYFFHRADGDPLVLAGLWERWARGDDERLSATVLTTAAGPDVPVHDRQPVVLEPDDWARWLDPDLEGGPALETLLHPCEGVLVHHAVSRDVSSVRNDGPQLVEPVAAPG